MNPADFHHDNLQQESEQTADRNTSIANSLDGGAQAVDLAVGLSTDADGEAGLSAGTADAADDGSLLETLWDGAGDVANGALDALGSAAETVADAVGDVLSGL